jgi:large subunit ribosomal protein L18
MRKARHERLRKRLAGTADRPRLAVFRSLKHISAQVIDDTKGVTLCAASTLEKKLGASAKIEGAKVVGAELAKRAKAKGIGAVVFDRGGFRYQGVIAGLAEGAREAGLEF